MSNAVSVFQYNNAPVSFLKGNGTMVNATQMARAFGKEVFQWFDNPGTHEFIHALAQTRGIEPITHIKNPTAQNKRSLNTSQLAAAYPQLVKVVRGGLVNEVEQGTWLHEDLALAFAQWLSPVFAIWCNDRIKELLTVGITATQPTIDRIINDPDLGIQLLQNLKEERAKRQLAQQHAQQAQEQLQQAQPKVLFADAVATSQRSCLVAELAKILQQNGVAIGQNRLFCWLRDNGYLCQKGQYYNQPTQKAMELGLFELKQTTITKPDGVVLVSTTPKVTGKGQIYFTNKFLATSKNLQPPTA